jgi:hypothetical protein
MPGIVFILGAGASHGECLKRLDDRKRAARSTVTPPLIDGFFRRELWEEIGYDAAAVKDDFRDAFDYIRYLKRLDDPPGEGSWRAVNVEEVFTFVELEREYRGQESDYGAKLTLIRNQLVRYICRILGYCTQGVYGEFARILVSNLKDSDSVISFNYDLIVDTELRAAGNAGRSAHYLRFFEALFRESQPPYGDSSEQWLRQGMFLKMHGSLNWRQCTNLKCPESSRIDPSEKIEECLDRAIGIRRTEESCRRCGSETVSLLIPPLLRKPVADNWIFRSAWGLARYRLGLADAIVIVGYSAPASDFYSKWLLQSTVGVRGDCHVYVINPANSKDHPDYEDFGSRMSAVFPYGYDREFVRYEQIEKVTAKARTAVDKRQTT